MTTVLEIYIGMILHRLSCSGISRTTFCLRQVATCIQYGCSNPIFAPYYREEAVYMGCDNVDKSMAIKIALLEQNYEALLFLLQQVNIATALEVAGVFILTLSCCTGRVGNAQLQQQCWGGRIQPLYTVTYAPFSASKQPTCEDIVSSTKYKKTTEL